MVVEVVTIEVDLLDSIRELQQAIEIALAKWEHNSCWILSDVDFERQKAIVDAVVTKK